MKTLELKLKKDVLIVEIPRLADYEFINKESKYLKVGNEEIKLNASTLDKFEFLCKGSELTEEIASELVDYWQNMANDGFIFENYKDNIPKKLTANDALISAVESKGFHWLKHNIKPFSLYDPRSKTGCHDLEEEEIVKKQWQDAEEKTFKNPLIFVKK